MQAVDPVVEAILARRQSHPQALALLVGLSGIDGSGKGYLASQLVGALTATGLKTAAINVDGWLNLPDIRFDPRRPAENFYENALRLVELFARLVLPLRENRSACVTMEWGEETAKASRPYTDHFENVDVIVLEGAYLFKRSYRRRFDLAVWVDCSWETALERSIARAHEGLPPDETVRAYRTIFFPAEEIHFALDGPRGAADIIVANDPLLTERGAAGASSGRADQTGLLEASLLIGGGGTVVLKKEIGMENLDSTVGSLDGTRLSLTSLLRHLRIQGRLGPLIREALAAQFLQEQARQAGLSATAEELQAAADHFRRRHGLHSAADTRDWLAARGLSVDDFEASLEQELLAAKLQQHLTGTKVDSHFAAHQADFERLRLALVLAPREDLARELLSQVREEGRDLDAVAREQGLHLDRFEKLRKEMSGPLGSALGSAGVGELVGPVATPRGFALVVIEECRPADLDSSTRQRIHDELFEGWLLARLREAKIDLPLAGGVLMVGKLLARYPLFRLLSARQLDDWIASGQEIACATGETIFQENTPGAWVYLVLDGKVRILRQSGERELTLGTLQAGDVFGEYGLLPPGRNTATCRTAAAARLLQMPLAPLRTVVQGLKPVWKNLKNWLRLHTLLHFRRERTFLGFMSAESGLKLLDRLQPAAFPAGQTIQANGLAADCWYVIEQGTVRLHAAESETAGLDLGPGDTFGERGLAGSGELPVAVALSDVRCQVLARHDFDPSIPIPSKVAQSYQPRLPARPAAHVWVPQLGRSDCGLAALTMVGLRFGAKVSVEELRAKVLPAPEGLSLQQLRQVASEQGLPCQSVRVSVDRLAQVSLPAVLHLSDGHYVVLHELSEVGVVVGDPEAGIVTWSLEFLAQCYSGALLLFDLPRRER